MNNEVWIGDAWSAMLGGLAARMVRDTVTVSSVAGGTPAIQKSYAVAVRISRYA